MVSLLRLLHVDRWVLVSLGLHLAITVDPGDQAFSVLPILMVCTYLVQQQLQPKGQINFEDLKQEPFLQNNSDFKHFNKLQDLAVRERSASGSAQKQSQFVFSGLSNFNENIDDIAKNHESLQNSI